MDPQPDEDNEPQQPETRSQPYGDDLDGEPLMWPWAGRRTDE